MRDKLEGTRSDDLTGVDLRKRQKGKSVIGWAPRIVRSRYLPGWILAVLVVVLGVHNLWRETSGQAPGSHDSGPKAEAPDRSFLSSNMEKVVIAEFTPSERRGDQHYAAKVRLIGRDGMEMERRLPLTCSDTPIEARLHRVVMIRADTWRLRGGGEEKYLSPDDAEAALCGDFAGRDVGVERRTAGEEKK